MYYHSCSVFKELSLIRIVTIVGQWQAFSLIIFECFLKLIVETLPLMSPVCSNEYRKCEHWGIYKSELVMSHSMRLFENLDQKDI